MAGMGYILDDYNFCLAPTLMRIHLKRIAFTKIKCYHAIALLLHYWFNHVIQPLLYSFG